MEKYFIKEKNAEEIHKKAIGRKWIAVRANAGSTMVEVLVAFVLLSIILVGLFQIMKLSSNMKMDAVDELKAQTRLQERYYTNDSALTVKVIPAKITMTQVDAQGNELNDAPAASFSLSDSNVKLIETIDYSEDTPDISIYTLSYEE